LVLRWLESEKLQKVLGGSAKAQFGNDFFQTLQENETFCSGFLDMTVQQLHDRLPLSVDPSTHLTSELAVHAGLDICITWD
jgi:hypothetical protein